MHWTAMSDSISRRLDITVKRMSDVPEEVEYTSPRE
jgi:hypothetical protein